MLFCIKKLVSISSLQILFDFNSCALYDNVWLLTWVTGSFMMSTSVTVPNMPKYSFNFSEDVCQLSPPTNNFPGAGSPPLGVERPEDPFWLPFIVGIRPLPCRSWSISPFPSMPAELQQTKIMWIIVSVLQWLHVTAPMAAPSVVCVTFPMSKVHSANGVW